jgi:hypothetical protein
MNGAKAVSGVEQTRNRQQVNEVIGDLAASSGAGTPYRSTEVLSDGTIKDMILTFLTKDDDKDDKGTNPAALTLAKQLYDAASQLQGAANISGSMGSMSGGMGQGGGLGGGMGGGAIAR